MGKVIKIYTIMLSIAAIYFGYYAARATPIVIGHLTYGIVDMRGIETVFTFFLILILCVLSLVHLFHQYNLSGGT